MSAEYPISEFKGNDGGKYGFSPSRLPFAELRPGSKDSFTVQFSEEMLREHQARIRPLIFNAARAKGMRVRVLLVDGGLAVMRVADPVPK